MSYFSDNYSLLRFPLSNPGLRVAQAGAIHAIAGHFSMSTEAGLVVMPTGSGKTAVLLAAPFVLRGERALIITPSRLVRGQITDGARTLEILKLAQALPSDATIPRVAEIDSKLGTEADWLRLRDYDFVIATPNCTSPEMEGVAKAPLELFDVVLIDEAHHAGAKTWLALIEHFTKAKRVLFTATPYRRDKKLIRAKSIFTYSVRKAFEDGIFGKVHFVPVHPAPGVTSDEAIARQTEELFRADRAAGLAHAIMVRTDSRSRADELREVYQRHTTLNLQVIHSGHSAAFVRKSIDRLRDGTRSHPQTESPLDGVICVDMMGEGFDFPNLKIAAIHAPHRSLAVTLQFVGRFARTSGTAIGEAHFVAVPDEIAGETEELFHEGAVWNDIVPNLSEARVAHEQHVREVNATFKKQLIAPMEESDLEFDLASIKPYCHVKIYTVGQFIGFDKVPDLPSTYEVVQEDVSEEHQCSILLIREQTRPRWTNYDELSKIEYDVILTYYDEASQHLFICSSRRDSMALYDAIGEHYSNKTNQYLDLYEINRVLHDLDKPVAFQVGMKNSVTSNNTESYQIKMGPSVAQSVSDTDGKLYHRGHIFLRAEERGQTVNIGYSSGSKVWSNTSARVPEIIDWCKRLGTKLLRRDNVVTGTNLDYLGVGEPIAILPADVIAVAWNDDVYESSVELECAGCPSIQLHDISIEILTREVGLTLIQLVWQGGVVPLRLELKDSRIEVIAGTEGVAANVVRRGERIPLLSYLKESHFHLYLSDFSRISGKTLFRAHSQNGMVLSHSEWETRDWQSAGVNICEECKQDGQGGADSSIHGFLKGELAAGASEVVVYDHRTGEIGDFISLREGIADIEFGLYHCKSSCGAKPGARVDDVYEVAGQVVKSLIWLKRPEDLKERILRRLDGGSEFLKGDRAKVKALFTTARKKPLKLTIYLVQPGISIAELCEKMTCPMAAARDYVARSCRGEVKFVISA